MKRGHLAWGLFLGALLVLAAGAWRSEGGRWLLLVDRSASLSGAALQVQDQVQILRAELGEGVQLQDFGDAAHTDLEAALRGALALHARTPLAGLVVLSDAQATRGDSEAGLRAVHTAGLPLHWRAVAAQGPALQLDELLAPQRATPVERVTLLQRWQGELSVAAELELLAQGPGGETRRAAVSLAAGSNAQSVTLPPLGAGEWRISVRLRDEGGALLAARDDAALLSVQAGVDWLLIERRAGALGDALQRGAWAVQRIAPAGFPAWSERLGSLRGVVLDDLAAADLDDAQWQALGAAVRQGLGLLLLGGEHSFAAGAYRGSRLEALLPLLAEPPRNSQALQLIFLVDKSGSMGQGADPRLARAQSAVQGALALLGPDDRVGLTLFDAGARVVQTLAPVAEARERLATPWSAAAGGTRLAPALAQALAQFEAQSGAGQRLLVLVSDGQFDEAPLPALAQRLRAARVELLWLQLQGADAGGPSGPGRLRALLGDALEWQAVGEAAELPLRLREALLQRRASVERGPLPVRGRVPGLPALPPLDAHPVTRLRPGAELLLSSERGDPLWAEHRVGLGRVLALAPGLGEMSAAWMRDPAWPELAATLLERVGGGGAAAHLQREGRRVRVQVAAAASQRPQQPQQPPHSADPPRLHWLAAEPVELPLQALGEGSWQALLPATLPDGVQHLRLSGAGASQRLSWLQRSPREGERTGVAAELADWRAAGWVQAVEAPLPKASRSWGSPQPGALLLALLLVLAAVGVERWPRLQRLVSSAARASGRAMAASDSSKKLEG